MRLSRAFVSEPRKAQAAFCLVIELLCSDGDRLHLLLAQAEPVCLAICHPACQVGTASMAPQLRVAHRSASQAAHSHIRAPPAVPPSCASQ